MHFLKKYFIFLFLIFFTFSGCSNNIFRRADVKDIPINVNDRVKKNIEEGRGIRFGKGSSSGGTFDFASSNELWRASMDVLNFVPFSNASYSGGILITEWFDGNSNDQNEKRDLKITVRFLSNEISPTNLKIIVHKKVCDNKSSQNCRINIEPASRITEELTRSIVQLAAKIEKENKNKK